MKNEYIRLRMKVIELHGSETFMLAMSDAETSGVSVNPEIGKDADNYMSLKAEVTRDE